MEAVNFDILANLPEFRTKRLFLRKISRQDAQDLFECLSDTMVTERMMHRPIHKISNMILKIEQYIEDYREGVSARWAVQEISSGKVIGSVMMYTINNPTRAVIGFYLNRNFWGCGYATEMVRATIAFAFDKIGLNRIEGDCFVENIASAHVMERSGMCCEGISKDYYFVDGVQRTVARYAILRKGWEEELKKHG